MIGVRSSVGSSRMAAGRLFCSDDMFVAVFALSISDS